MNPGYDVHHSDRISPKLSREPDVDLVDFIFSRRLFTMYLTNMCNPTFPRQHAIMTRVGEERRQNLILTYVRSIPTTEPLVSNVTNICFFATRSYRERVAQAHPRLRVQRQRALSRQSRPV